MRELVTSMWCRAWSCMATFTTCSAASSTPRLADFPHGVEFNPSDPQVKKLIANWVEQYTELFPSPFVHVGFDETWQLQQAAAKGTGAPAAIFLEQLNNVSRLFQQHGKTILAWADIMVKIPDIVKQLPPGIIAVAWWYEPQPDPEYHRWLDPLIAKHVPYLVAPGVNGWNEIAPDYNLSFENIDTFIASGTQVRSLGRDEYHLVRRRADVEASGMAGHSLRRGRGLAAAAGGSGAFFRCLCRA